jgi:hypothetical protein
LQEPNLSKTNHRVVCSISYAQEIEKCEKLISELSICHDTISNLRNENAKLIAKVDKLMFVMILLSTLKMIMLV